MVTATANHTCIKYHIKFATNPIYEALTYQGVVVDYMYGFNDGGHKVACYTARKPGGGDKGVKSLPLQRQDLPFLSTPPSVIVLNTSSL